jgi:hypothetical protein
LSSADRRTYVSQGAVKETQAEGRKQQRGPCLRFLSSNRERQILLLSFPETSLVFDSKKHYPRGLASRFFESQNRLLQLLADHLNWFCRKAMLRLGYSDGYF